MKAKDVRLGMKVVPHDKTAFSQSMSFNEWLDMTDGEFFKQNGYVFVTYDWGKWGFVLSRNANNGIGEPTFYASDFEPYIEQQKQKFGGYIQGNKTVVYIGEKKGEANYNPNDAKHGLPYNKAYGIALAACRAEGVDTSWLDKAIQTGKADYLTEAVKKWNSGDKVKAIKFYREKTDCELREAKDTIEASANKQSESHSVIIDGVKYVKEEKK